MTCGEKVRWSREKREREPDDGVGLKFGTLHPPTKMAEENDTRLAAVRLRGMAWQLLETDLFTTITQYESEVLTSIHLHGCLGECHQTAPRHFSDSPSFPERHAHAKKRWDVIFHDEQGGRADIYIYGWGQHARSMCYRYRLLDEGSLPTAGSAMLLSNSSARIESHPEHSSSRYQHAKT